MAFDTIQRCTEQIRVGYVKNTNTWDAGQPQGVPIFRFLQYRLHKSEKTDAKTQRNPLYSEAGVPIGGVNMTTDNITEAQKPGQMFEAC